MPKTFDLLLGIATVMLLLSLAVTAITHYLVGLANLRGRHLRAGLASLLERLDARIGPRHATALARTMLTDPLVSETAGRMASFVHRAQFTRFCLAIASEAAPGDTENEPQTYASAAEALYWTLRAHGVVDPQATLDRIAHHALDLEQAHPGLPETARLEMAVISAAAAPLVARINGSFDQTMDCVSARFTGAVRAITLGVALLLAAVLQVDCLAMVNHLSIDEALRRQVVSAALEGRAFEGSGTPLRRALNLELVRIPASWTEWRREWNESGGAPGHAAGILLTAMLLSLGAPFWYSLLGSALRLRPALAVREERGSHAARNRKPAALAVATSSPASSTRPLESAEWHPSRENRCTAGHR